MFEIKQLSLYIFSIVVVIIILLIIFPVYTLELRSLYDRELFFVQRIHPGDKFTLKYKHSVELSPVWEIFVIDENYQIVLIETDFLDHGAGLPYAAFDEEIFISEEGKFKIKNMHRIMPSPINYMIGAIYENTLYLENKEINLSSLLGDKLITIKLNKSNLFSYLTHRRKIYNG
jgi:hypothetical protein